MILKKFNILLLTILSLAFSAFNVFADTTAKVIVDGTSIKCINCSASYSYLDATKNKTYNENDASYIDCTIYSVSPVEVQGTVYTPVNGNVNVLITVSVPKKIASVTNEATTKRATIISASENSKNGSNDKSASQSNNKKSVIVQSSNSYGKSKYSKSKTEKTTAGNSKSTGTSSDDKKVYISEDNSVVIIKENIVVDKKIPYTGGD